MIRQNYRESEMAFFLDTDKQRINRIKLQVNSKLFGIQDSSSLRKNLKEHFWQDVYLGYNIFLILWESIVYKTFDSQSVY